MAITAQAARAIGGASQKPGGVIFDVAKLAQRAKLGPSLDKSVIARFSQIGSNSKSVLETSLSVGFKYASYSDLDNPSVISVL